VPQGYPAFSVCSTASSAYWPWWFLWEWANAWRTLSVDLYPGSGHPDPCLAGGLIRDVFVAATALGGAFLWQISPQVNLIAAFVFGVVGTVGFAVFGSDTIAKPGTESESRPAALTGTTLRDPTLNIPCLL
jgi:hypothetical protein